MTTPRRRAPRTQPGPNSEFMSTDQVAEMTGVNSTTLRYWRHIDSGPSSFRLGARVLYRRNAVQAWIREQERATRRGGVDA